MLFQRRSVHSAVQPDVAAETAATRVVGCRLRGRCEVAREDRYGSGAAFASTLAPRLVYPRELPTYMRSAESTVFLSRATITSGLADRTLRVPPSREAHRFILGMESPPCLAAPSGQSPCP
jgi:hypothetical protein